MGLFNGIKFPFLTEQQMNLDWILQEIKRVMGFFPESGDPGTVLMKTEDGTAWEELAAVDININGVPEDTELTDTDKLIFYDISSSANRKITAPNLLNSMMSNGTPLMDGTASAGTSKKPARYDHKHPTDTSRQAALSGTQMNAVNSGAPANSFSSGKLKLEHGGTDADNAADARTNLEAGDVAWDPIYVGSISTAKTLTFSGQVSFLLVVNANNTARQGIWIVFCSSGSSPSISAVFNTTDVTLTPATNGLSIVSAHSDFATIIPITSSNNSRITISE